MATSNLQLLYRNAQKSPLANLHFGGRHFAFWRLKLSWGCFIRKGGPQKGWWGAELAPKVVLGKLGLLTPKLRISFESLQKFKGHIIKAFSLKRGLIFTVNGASSPPPLQIPPPPPPLTWETPPLGFSVKPPPPPQNKGGAGARGRRAGGRGRGAGGWGGGGAEAPFTAKTSPLFGENAFKGHIQGPPKNSKF